MEMSEMSESGNGEDMVWWTGLLLGYLSDDVCKTFTDAGLELIREVRDKRDVNTEIIIKVMVWNPWG